MTFRFDELVGPTLVNGKGEELPSLEALQGKKFVMLYFSARWNGPSLKFTPLLAGAYRAHKEHIIAGESDAHDRVEAKEIEVVFVSFDSVKSEYEQYQTPMPWLTMPWPVWRIKEELSKKYGVDNFGLPALVVLDGNSGEVVSKNGRGEFADYFEGSYETKPPSRCVVS